MTVYHIKRDGTPGVCSAEGACPLGGADAHFPTEEAAYNEAQRRMEDMFGVISDEKVKANILSSSSSNELELNVSEIREVFPRGNMTIVIKNSGERIVCDTPYSEFERFGL